MNADNFAEWLRRQEYTVEKTASTYWYEAGKRVFQAFPFHWLIVPEESELKDLLCRSGAIALRYSAPINSSVGRISYHAVYDKFSYNLNNLDRRSRQNIRRGLKNCQVRPIAFERLAEEGWLLEVDTAKRQGRETSISKEIWHRRYTAAADLKGFEAWGALIDDRLVASLFTFQMEDCCEMISQQCHRDYLNARINNALSYVVTEKVVNRSKNGSVFYAAQSLDAPASVDQFKFRMGYSAKPVRQRVAFHPFVSPFVNRSTYAVVRRIRDRWPSKPFFTKTEGIFRFYLEGKKKPKDQDWPECLARSKAEMMKLLMFHSELKEAKNEAQRNHPELPDS
jgi:hypothetical protein